MKLCILLINLPHTQPVSIYLTLTASPSILPTHSFDLPHSPTLSIIRLPSANYWNRQCLTSIPLTHPPTHSISPTPRCSIFYSSCWNPQCLTLKDWWWQRVDRTGTITKVIKQGDLLMEGQGEEQEEEVGRRE